MKNEITLHLMHKTRRGNKEEDHLTLEILLQIPRIPIEY